MASVKVKPDGWCAILTPSGLHKIVKTVPNSTISLGKYGSFPVNLIIGRPFHLTYEILDKQEGDAYSDLRIVSATELNAEVLSEASAHAPLENGEHAEADTESFDIVADDGQYLMRNNRLTIDDPSRQGLKLEEIEMLKKGINTDSGKEIIAKIMASHAALDEKTRFALAKYKLRKSRKYLKRFTVLPLDVSMLQKWLIHEKDAPRIMELREETLGLIHSWSNVHGGHEQALPAAVGQGRWLVVDDIAGLLVAGIAERMGLLYPDDNTLDNESKAGPLAHDGDAPEVDAVDATPLEITDKMDVDATSPLKPHRRRPPLPEAMSATSNTITLVHAATQPNLSLLSYFDYDPNQPSRHPLHTHLKTLSWLQLLQPESTRSYADPPETIPDEQLAQLKPSKRGLYYRKRRRWERTVRLVNETREGGFDGLVVATVMKPVEVVHKLAPLVRGGGSIVVYSATAPSLVQLSDAYSTARKTAYLTRMAEGTAEEPGPQNEDFPVDPRLVLAPMLQTARAREWQVLPGRTHPVMTARGGSEGYVFTATRVIPSEVQIEARGAFAKRRKVEQHTNGSASQEATLAAATEA